MNIFLFLNLLLFSKNFNATKLTYLFSLLCDNNIFYKKNFLIKLDFYCKKLVKLVIQKSVAQQNYKLLLNTIIVDKYIKINNYLAGTNFILLYFIINKVILCRAPSCLKKDSRIKETTIKFKIINITLVQFRCYSNQGYL